jgi:sporulation protein YlmC with PRC-barrel domain
MRDWQFRQSLSNRRDLMKKLNSLALIALMAPAVTLGIGSALADESRSQPPTTTHEAEGPTEQRKGPHVLTVPEAERTPAEAEADKRAQQERADEDTQQARGASQEPIMDQRTAQDATRDSTRAPEATPAPYLTSQPANAFRVDQLMGSNVKSRTDAKTIGSISDLLINDDGQIIAVIVEAGGFLGMGQRHVAIPWHSVERTLNEKGDGYELHVSGTKDSLNDAPEYKTDSKNY